MDGPHQLGKVKRHRSPSSAAHPGWSMPSGTWLFLPQQARRVLPLHSACLFASVAASGGVVRYESRCCCGRAACSQSGVSFPRWKAGKCSFATAGVILTAFATQGRLSAREMEHSQCWGWEHAFKCWEEIRGWGDGCSGSRWESVRAEAAPSWAIERCAAAHVLGSLVLHFSNHKAAVTLLLGAPLTAQPSVHDDKRLPVLQVNLFSSCMRRQQ